MWVTSKLKHFVMYMDINILQKETEKQMMSLLPPTEWEFKHIYSYVYLILHITQRQQ